MKGKKCSKCSGDGPFPKWSNVCIKCQSEEAVQWQREHPEQFAARMRGWRKNNPKSASQIASRNYQKRKTSGKIDQWKRDNREQVNFIARVGYWKRRLLMKEEIKKVVQDSLAQAKQEGLSDEDAKWLAVGAVNRAARQAGVIGEVLTPEMNAASQAVVKEVQMRGK